MYLIPHLCCFQFLTFTDKAVVCLSVYLCALVWLFLRIRSFWGGMAGSVTPLQRVRLPSGGPRASESSWDSLLDFLNLSELQFPPL